MTTRGNPYGWKDKNGNKSGIHKNTDYVIIRKADGNFVSYKKNETTTKTGYVRKWIYGLKSFKMVKL